MLFAPRRRYDARRIHALRENHEERHPDGPPHRGVAACLPCRRRHGGVNACRARVARPPQAGPAQPDLTGAGNLGPMKEPEYMARMEAAFNKQDINADGYLTRGPLLQEATAEQITAMDTDGDGRISKAEFLAYALKNFNNRPKFEQNHNLKR
ncbi:EF-hand domain-containing protein [Achromobacter ruhlandii]|uniref:EF-hand domain-containing protein n=2 Tax=Achromobacter ruhlandii TaxID=72557 RepID=UPI001EEEA75E|nr:EF-hand domain-containing protein [Achromobacter ruhlandii]